jgi:hypothetical protein
LIWDYEAEEILTEFEVAPERASTLAISQDGCLIAVGDFIGNIHLYGVQKY